MSDTELMSGCIIRHRVVREEALHTAANGDGDEHGADYADSDESFVEEENPRSRYQRYLQSTLEEVSDPDDWCDIHYGHATQDSPVHGEGEDESGAISPRSISRGSERNEEPQPKSMPIPLAKQGARRNAMDTAMDMAETISNRGGPSCSSADPEIAECTNTDYFLSSVPMASF